jgi:hypothetical protein
MTDRAPSDDFLDRAIDAIAAQMIPALARQQCIEKAVTLYARRGREPGALPSHFRRINMRWGIAAVLLLAAGIGFSTYERSFMRRAPRMESYQTAAPQAINPSRANDTGSDMPGSAAYLGRPAVSVFVAERAPILVCNGPAAPLELGAKLAENTLGGAMHVWDWSKSSTSTIFPGVELSSNEQGALSADGNILVRADGTIVRLRPHADGNEALPKQIDLGGADYREGASTYRRIGAMRFSPGGKRLALLVTLRNADKSVRDVIRIIEFPSGKQLCEFAAGEPYALRVAFSADGKEIAAGDPQNRIVLRDCQSGKITRQFDPSFKGQVMAIAISGDGKQIAAGARQGDLIVWQKETGKIAWQTDNVKLGRRADAEGVELLGFSPDNQHLAAACWGPLFVFDSASGKVEGRIESRFSVAMQWSADARTIALVSPAVSLEVAGKRAGVVYPKVSQFDWHSGKAVK